MYVWNELTRCSGCGLCAIVCVQKAITMVQGENCFKYPKINIDLCTDCGACRAVCPFTIEHTAKNTILQAYALKHNDTVREGSSSGGFFTLFSDWVLNRGGVVYGAVWSEKFAVTHIRATTKIDRDRMRTSKYVQSDIHLVFESIKNDVATGILVLFTGTPCQCAAVTRLFGKQEPENLLIMDMVCHGVMSQEFFDAYLADVCQKHLGQEIETINMRDKRYGWQMIGIDFADGTQYHSEEDYFYKAYAAHALQRPSCFNCTCAIEKRFGDFTVGDFWGVQKSHPELYDELGVSLVLVNSPKAQEIYCQLEQNVVSVPIEPKDYLPYQPNLSSPTPRGKKADKFASYYNKYGYKITMHRFFDVTFMRRVNALGYKLLKKFLYK